MNIIHDVYAFGTAQAATIDERYSGRSDITLQVSKAREITERSLCPSSILDFSEIHCKTFPT